MVALCLDHHKRADAGAFTTDQLRQMKAHAAEDPIRGVFDWRREQLIVRAGGMTAIGCGVILQFGTSIGDRNAIWLSSDERGHELLNLDMWGNDGRVLFSMRGNDWVTITEVDDLECAPSGKSLVLRASSLGMSLRLSFATATREQLRERYHRIGLDVAKESTQHHQQWLKGMGEQGAPAEFRASMRERHSDPDAEAAEFARHVVDAVAADEVALCDMTGEFVFPAPITITSNKLVLPGRNTFTGALSGWERRRNPHRIGVGSASRPRGAGAGVSACVRLARPGTISGQHRGQHHPPRADRTDTNDPGSQAVCAQLRGS
jgi:hypothetical protein